MLLWALSIPPNSVASSIGSETLHPCRHSRHISTARAMPGEPRKVPRLKSGPSFGSASRVRKMSTMPRHPMPHPSGCPAS